MKYIIAGTFIAIFCLWAWRSYSRYKSFVWRTDRISATIERDDQYLKMGQYLFLVQNLGEEGFGWLNMKINIPEFWDVNNITVQGGFVRIETTDSGDFALHRRNVGKLSFAILDGGDNKPDEQLAELWSKHAANAA